MTGTQIIIIVVMAIGIIAVLASFFMQDKTLTTKKEKQRLEEKEAEATKQFDAFLEQRMKTLKEEIESFQLETFNTLTKNAVHDVEVAANEAVDKMNARTEEIKKQIDEFFENNKKEIGSLDSQYQLKLEEYNKEVVAKTEDLLEKTIKDVDLAKEETKKASEDILNKTQKEVELIKEEANKLVSSLEEECFERSDKAAKEAIDELDIVTVFKELYEKSDLANADSSEETTDSTAEEVVEKTENTTNSGEEAKEATTSAKVEVIEEDLTDEKANEELVEDDLVIAGIKELAKTLENTNFDVSEEELENLKEKEGLTNDEKTDIISDLTEAEDLGKTKVIPKLEDISEPEGDKESEEIPKEVSGNEESTEEIEEEPAIDEEESKLFKVLRETDIFSSHIDEQVVSEVLRLNRKKKTSMQIAGEVGIGIAEVRTIIDLLSE